MADRDNIAVLAALGMLAYGASMLTHEALGHGGVCALGGGHTVMLTAWGEGCSVQPAGIAAAGPGLQIAAGLLSWLALRFVPGRFAHLRVFLWLFMVFDLLIAAGYAVLSGVTGFGDAAVTIAGLSLPVLWRGLLIVGGGALYYAAMWAGALELKRFGGSDAPRLTRLAVVPYLAAGAMACIGGALNHTMGQPLALELAAASSFGGGLGMIRMPDLSKTLPRVAPGPCVPVTWRWSWGLAGAAGAAAFVLVLGRGIG